ncbi:cysteine-rich receptor-like protein kinase 25 [Fagus crenata]
MLLTLFCSTKCVQTTLSAPIVSTNPISTPSSLQSPPTPPKTSNSTTPPVAKTPLNLFTAFYDCRGDVTIQVCRTCVVAAVKKMKNKCSREKIAVIMYDECLLRYSNRSFFSTVDEKPRLGLLNTQNVTDQDKFNKLLNTTMIELARETTSNVSIGDKKFGTKEEKANCQQQR